MLDNILTGSNFDSYAVSLFFTLIILLLAHIAGTLVRQIRGSYEERIYYGNIVAALSILTLLAVCVGALTIGRASFSSIALGPQVKDIFSEITRKIQDIGIFAAFISSLSDQAAFFLAAINGAGIAGAFFLAFISHDSDRVYQGALDAVDSAERKLSVLNEKYSSGVNRIAKAAAPILSSIVAAHGSQNARVIALKRNRGVACTRFR